MVQFIQGGGMISVNGQTMEWTPDLTFPEILTAIGYRIPNPRVLIRLDGETVQASERKTRRIPDGAEIVIINTLSGG